MGIGAMDDCMEFNDSPKCNTLKNVCEFNGGLNLPNMAKMGLGNIQNFKGVTKTENPTAKYGTLVEKSKGKDTTTGHWEMTGIISEKPFATFPHGFQSEIIDKFIQETNCGGVLANHPASGTAIIAELNDEHHKTGFPIVYTSADSVFQIAVDTDFIPLETLYHWCEVARKILNNYNVSRVIARPYKVIDGKPTRISKDRRDYSMVPPYNVMNKIVDNGLKVYGIGKIEDIFAKSGISKAIHTGSNKEGLELTLEAVKHEKDMSLIFTNLVDTDMLFGHRNDAKGYGKAIEEIDTYVDDIVDAMQDEDLLIITADHGCDPTVEGTDHTREKVPVLIYSKSAKGDSLGEIIGFDYIAKTVEKHLEI